MTVLPLESGSAMFVEPHNDKPLLIDCGSDSGGRFSVVSFLRTRGHDEPPWAVATHGDRHHVQGFGSLAEEMGWPVMFVNPTRLNSPYYKKMMEGLEAAGQPTIAGWEVLHPPTGERLSKADDNMTVLNTLADGGIEIVIRRNGQWRIESMHGREVSTPLGELITP